jgi:ADP-ribose pyrophosphatase YjhB (NUDIX family)
MTPKWYSGPMLATDALIEYSKGGAEGLVLIERLNFPFGHALPGGMQETDINTVQNACKEALEETGLQCTPKRLSGMQHYKPIMILDTPGRDPRGPVYSLVYVVQGTGTIAEHGRSDAKSARFYNCRELCDLVQTPDKWAFPDHAQPVQRWLQERGYNA